MCSVIVFRTYITAQCNTMFACCIFCKRCFAKKICTACSRTSYKIVPLTYLNKYLYNGKSEIQVNINNNSEKLFKKKHCGLRLIDLHPVKLGNDVYRFREHTVLSIFGYDSNPLFQIFIFVSVI